MDEVEEMEMVNEVYDLIETEAQRELRLNRLMSKKESDEE